MYNTVEEARQKLGESTVLFNGVPVFIYGAHTKNKEVYLEYVPLPLNRSKSSEKQVLNINDPAWDFKSMGSRLGYVNVSSDPYEGKRQVVFVSRVPTRHSRQGLDNRTAHVTPWHTSGIHWEWNSLLYDEGTLKTFTSKFPTHQEANKMLLAEEIPQVAISRKLMMIFDKVNPPNLVYRNEKIGYTTDGETFKLAPHKFYLKEELVDMENLKIS